MVGARGGLVGGNGELVFDGEGVSGGEDGEFCALGLGSAGPIACPQARLGGKHGPDSSPPAE